MFSVQMVFCHKRGRVRPSASVQLSVSLESWGMTHKTWSHFLNTSETLLTKLLKTNVILNIQTSFLHDGNLLHLNLTKQYLSVQMWLDPHQTRPNKSGQGPLLGLSTVYNNHHRHRKRKEIFAARLWLDTSCRKKRYSKTKTNARANSLSEDTVIQKFKQYKCPRERKKEIKTASYLLPSFQAVQLSNMNGSQQRPVNNGRTSSKACTITLHV